jgi:hypothetical protein
LRKIEDGPLISPHRPETAPPSHERVEINLAEPRQDHASPNSPVAGLPVRENAKAQACSSASARARRSALSFPRQSRRFQSSGMLKGFGRRPFAAARGLGAGPASESLVRRKPRVGKGVVWLARRDLWGFWGRGQSAGRASEGGGAHCSGRERRGRAFSRSRMRAAGVSAAPGESLRRSYGHRLPGLARGWRRGGTALRGGKRGDGHEVSTLIRVGDGERAGRAPWNVSTMIIRPPQHGH